MNSQLNITPVAGPTLLWGREALAAAAPSGTTWLWHGYVAAGAVTLLTSQWKAGKTTLASILLARMKVGGELAGETVAPGRAVVLSEEAPHQWQRRACRLYFGDHVGWFCRPFRDRPNHDDWIALLERIADLHERERLSLLMIDPLAAFLPAGSENDATGVLAALLPLQRLTSAGMGVFASHHPRKGRTRTGQAARGSSALSGFADILLEMRPHSRAVDDRRRRLLAFSRFDETPSDREIELTADGDDYKSLGALEDVYFADAWSRLSALLATAERKFCCAEIRTGWHGSRPPDDATLQRWLARAVDAGLLHRDGDGVRGSPYRYWLPAREAAWAADPRTPFRMPELMQSS